jgi:hypothetical protein
VWTLREVIWWRDQVIERDLLNLFGDLTATGKIKRTKRVCYCEAELVIGLRARGNLRSGDMLMTRGRVRDADMKEHGEIQPRKFKGCPS